MKIIALAAAILLSAIGAAQATQCNDGSYSSSSGRGTCSHHGGENGN